MHGTAEMKSSRTRRWAAADQCPFKYQKSHYFVGDADQVLHFMLFRSLGLIGQSGVSPLGLHELNILHDVSDLAPYYRGAVNGILLHYTKSFGMSWAGVKQILL